jgi:hypothetical protein
MLYGETIAVFSGHQQTSNYPNFEGRYSKPEISGTSGEITHKGMMATSFTVPRN